MLADEVDIVLGVGRDPSADRRGLMVARGDESEFPTLYELLEATSRFVDWSLPQNRGPLAGLKESPWRDEQRWHTDEFQRRVVERASDYRSDRFQAALKLSAEL